MTAGEALPPKLIREAARFVILDRVCTVHGIARRFHIGRERASRVLQVLEQHGVVGPHQEAKARDITAERFQLAEVLASLPGGDKS